MLLKHMKTDPPCTFPSITLLLDHLSKIWRTTFTFEKWPLVEELKLKHSRVGHFAFSSAIITLNILGHLVKKKTSLRILKDGLATELLRQACKGGSDFHVPSISIF